MLFRITGYRRKKAISVKKKEKKLKRIVAGLIILTIVVTSLPNLHLEKTFGQIGQHLKVLLIKCSTLAVVFLML